MRWLVLFLTFCSFTTIGQNIPNFESPKPAKLKTFNQDFVPSTTTNKPTKLLQNQQGIEQYKRDKKQAELAQLRKRQALLDAYLSTKQAATTIHYQFPSQGNKIATSHYRLALEGIKMMLSDSMPLSLKHAVFFVENAWYENTMPYKQFDGKIQHQVEYCQAKLAQEGFDKNNDLAKKWVLDQFMTDTTSIKSFDGEKTYHRLPYTYDFDDYMGKKDWTKMFVSKLIDTHSGQCHSMPLLYLILAEELEIKDTHLAISPNHSYIMMKGANNQWFNLELTSGQFVSDNVISQSGFINAKALENKLYMQPLTKKETIAQCLIDLADGYIVKFGFDEFALACYQEALKHHPKNITAIISLANYYTQLVDYIGHQMKYPPIELFLSDFEARKVMRKRNYYYQLIDKLGYTDMPEEAYQKWLADVAKEKAKQESKPLEIPLNQY